MHERTMLIEVRLRHHVSNTLLSLRTGRLRREHPIKQAVVAEALGISPSGVSEMESGKRLPSLAQCHILAELLEVPVQTLTVLPEMRGAVSGDYADCLRVLAQLPQALIPDVARILEFMLQTYTTAKRARS